MPLIACLVLLVVELNKRLKARRARIEREHDALERKLRELFAADETVPTDVIDAPWNRSEREIHHMTASELTKTNADFAGLIAANWPDKT